MESLTVKLPGEANGDDFSSRISVKEMLKFSCRVFSEVFDLVGSYVAYQHSVICAVCTYACLQVAPTCQRER
jgi:hypothetical protein